MSEEEFETPRVLRVVVPGVAAVLGFIVLGIPTLIGFTEYARGACVAWFAPRLYVIEQLSSLL